MARRLRPVQVWGEFRSRLCPRVIPSQSLMADARAATWSNAVRRGPYLWGPLCDQNPEEVAVGKLDLIGWKIDLGGTDPGGINWAADEGADHHWQKMLHSLDWLNALPPEQVRRLLPHYCAALPEAGDHMAVDPWTVAFRIQSVIRWHAQYGADHSLAPQVAAWTTFLFLNLEWRLMANHLLKDIVALTLAGRALQGPQSARWRERGDRLLLRCLKEDILPDGGHEELSPMYHSLVLFDLLDVLAYVQPDEQLFQPLQAACRRMVTFLRGTIHPDGEIANLNDSGFGMAPVPARILDQAAALDCTAQEPPRGLRIYRSFGVAILENSDWWVIFDGGEAALRHQPGHGHADSLTLEASFRGQRLFVDTGVSRYLDVATRDRERATTAHNTVTVAGRNSSDVYMNFRMGERARILRFDGGTAQGESWAEAEHDGYRFLPGKPTHFRRVSLTATGEFRVQDIVRSSRPQSWETRWYLAPGWSVQPPDSAAGAWQFVGPGGGRLEGWCQSSQARLETAQVTLRFGHPQSTTVLICPVEAGTESHLWRFRPVA